jgi:drug/metabolite transporter (DMT)-like permease
MSKEFGRAPFAAAFAAIYFLWGGTYLAIALGLQSIPPFLLIGLRSVLGGLALFALSQIGRLEIRPSRDWTHAAISGAFLFIGCHGALAYAQRFVPSGLAAIILATIPFWLVLVNLAAGERQHLRKLVGLVPGFCGVAAIAWSETSAGGHTVPMAMIVVLLASALAWALGSAYAQRYAAYIPPRDLAGMQLVCGGIGLLMISWASGEWANFVPQDVTMTSLAGLLYLAFLGSALGNTAYLWLLDHLPAPFVATYTFVNPVVAVILGMVVLSEHFALSSLAGAALVIISIVMLLFTAVPEQKSLATGEGRLRT